MTPAERQRRFKAKHHKPGYCVTCTKRKAIEGRKKCLQCTYDGIAAVYRSRDQEPPTFAQWKRKRKK